MDQTNGGVIINACKKMLLDRLQHNIGDVELQETINKVTPNIIKKGNTNEYNKEILRLVYEFYKERLADNLDNALLQRELLRQQPIATVPMDIKAMSDRPVIPQSITVSMQPPKKQYFRSFVVQSIKRDWNADPKRTLFVFEFPRFSYLIPFKICMPYDLKIPSLRLRLINGNGKYTHYDFFKDANPLCWSTIDDLEPLYCDSSNKFTVGLYDHYDSLLDIGEDNIRIDKITRIDTDLYEIPYEFNSDINVIANDEIYIFRHIDGRSYRCIKRIAGDVLRNAVCLVQGLQLSIFFKVYSS